MLLAPCRPGLIRTLLSVDDIEVDGAMENSLQQRCKQDATVSATYVAISYFHAVGNATI